MDVLNIAYLITFCKAIKKKYSLMRKINLNHHMIKRIADTVIATFIMFGVAVISPLLLAAYKEAKREEDWFRDILDKPE